MHSMSRHTSVGPDFLFPERQEIEVKKHKMRLNLSITAIVVLSLSLAFGSTVRGSHNLKPSVNSDAKSPGAVIKNFYFWYINAIEAGNDPFKKGGPTLQKYVTLRLIKQIERSESDADTFLQTQDWEAGWADNANVSNVRVKGATATAIVTFDATTNYPRVSVTLVKQAGVWKIDRVKDATQ